LVSPRLLVLEASTADVTLLCKEKCEGSVALHLVGCKVRGNDGRYNIIAATGWRWLWGHDNAHLPVWRDNWKRNTKLVVSCLVVVSVFFLEVKRLCEIFERESKT
jgi:hypothetical protein